MWSSFQSVHLWFHIATSLLYLTPHSKLANLAQWSQSTQTSKQCVFANSAHCRTPRGSKGSFSVRGIINFLFGEWAIKQNPSCRQMKEACLIHWVPCWNLFYECTSNDNQFLPVMNQLRYFNHKYWSWAVPCWRLKEKKKPTFLSNFSKK